jgi:DNA repair protein RadC
LQTEEWCELKTNYRHNPRKYTRRKIKDIPESDRPWGKMLIKGPEALSNLELMAALLGKGIKGKDVFEVASDIAGVVEKEFARLTLEKLLEIDGIGQAGACRIMAAIEFSKRFLLEEGIQLGNSSDVLPLVEELRSKKQEYFLTFTLDGGNYLIEKRTVFIGTLTESLIHPREIFADAITDRAAGIIFVHNHPGPKVYPSREDIMVTQRLIEVAELVGIDVHDHIIINKTDYFSFKKKGLLAHKDPDLPF